MPLIYYSRGRCGSEVFRCCLSPVSILLLYKTLPTLNYFISPQKKDINHKNILPFNTYQMKKNILPKNEFILWKNSPI